MKGYHQHYRCNWIWKEHQPAVDAAPSLGPSLLFPYFPCILVYPKGLAEQEAALPCGVQKASSGLFNSHTLTPLAHLPLRLQCWSFMWGSSGAVPVLWDTVGTSWHSRSGIQYPAMDSPGLDAPQRVLLPRLKRRTTLFTFSKWSVMPSRGLALAGTGGRSILVSCSRTAVGNAVTWPSQWPWC